MMLSKLQSSARIIPNIYFNQINPYFSSVLWSSRHWVIKSRQVYQNGFAIMNIITLAITNLLRIYVIISD